MKKYYKQIGILITVSVIIFNLYDFVKGRKSVRQNEIKICSEKFLKTNPNVSEEVANKYCSCVLEKLDGKYTNNSKMSSKEIIEKERKTMQECFDNAQTSKK